MPHSGFSFLLFCMIFRNDKNQITEPKIKKSQVTETGTRQHTEKCTQNTETNFAKSSTISGFLKWVFFSYVRAFILFVCS